MLSRCWATSWTCVPGDLASGRGARGPAAHRACVPVAALVDDSLGLQAYMRIDALHRLLREGPIAISGAALTVDPSALDRFYLRREGHAGRRRRRADAPSRCRTSARRWPRTMNLQIFFNVMFAAIIAFGVVYNSARVSLSERAASWPACACWASRAARFRSSCSASWPSSPLLALPRRRGDRVRLGQLIMLGFNNEMYRLSFTVVGRRRSRGRFSRSSPPRSSRVWWSADGWIGSTWSAC